MKSWPKCCGEFSLLDEDTGSFFCPVCGGSVETDSPVGSGDFDPLHEMISAFFGLTLPETEDFDQETGIFGDDAPGGDEVAPGSEIP